MYNVAYLRAFFDGLDLGVTVRPAQVRAPRRSIDRGPRRAARRSTRAAGSIRPPSRTPCARPPRVRASFEAPAFLNTLYSTKTPFNTLYSTKTPLNTLYSTKTPLNTPKITKALKNTLKNTKNTVSPAFKSSRRAPFSGASWASGAKCRSRARSCRRFRRTSRRVRSHTRDPRRCWSFSRCSRAF